MEKTDSPPEMLIEIARQRALARPLGRQLYQTGPDWELEALLSDPLVHKIHTLQELEAAKENPAIHAVFIGAESGVNFQDLKTRAERGFTVVFTDIKPV